MHRTGLEVTLRPQTQRGQICVAPAHRRFQVNKATTNQCWQRRLQSRYKQVGIKRRVEHDQLQAAWRLLTQRNHTVAALHLHGAGLQARLCQA